MKILIADDERDICEAVRRIVERAGHTCIAVYDGALALEAYERERPDLVIVDVMMPGLDGIRTTLKVRSLSRPAGSGCAGAHHHAVGQKRHCGQGRGLRRRVR